MGWHSLSQIAAVQIQNQTACAGRMMRTLLLTAGRGTYALGLARRFHSEGYRVLVSDAWPHTLCRYSSAVSRYFRVPSPARETSAWLDSIWEIAERQSVDLIIPVYEEVFYLAQAKAARKDGPPRGGRDAADAPAVTGSADERCIGRAHGARRQQRIG